PLQAPAAPALSTLSLHDALPIWPMGLQAAHIYARTPGLALRPKRCYTSHAAQRSRGAQLALSRVESGILKIEFNASGVAIDQSAPVWPAAMLRADVGETAFTPWAA